MSGFDFACSTISKHNYELETLYRKWNIKKVETIAGKSVGEEQMETYKVALIITAIVIGLLLLFAFGMFIRSKRR